MSEVKVNKITPTADCGTVTLGDSGDTIAIPARNNSYCTKCKRYKLWNCKLS